MARPAKKSAPINFETSIKRLEEIVRRLEDEQVPLEESLKLFAEGRRLASACEKELQKAENTIRMLVEDADGKLDDVPFEGEESFDDEPSVAAGDGTESIPNPKPDDDIPF